MIMIGGAGVVAGSILGAVALGFVEAIGTALLPGSVTYLLIFMALIVFLIVPAAGDHGQALGLSRRTSRHATGGTPCPPRPLPAASRAAGTGAGQTVLGLGPARLAPASPRSPRLRRRWCRSCSAAGPTAQRADQRLGAELRQPGRLGHLLDRPGQHRPGRLRHDRRLHHGHPVDPLRPFLVALPAALGTGVRGDRQPPSAGRSCASRASISRWSP